ncbi:PhzF family phenazine biosynthesis protein [Actinosynnema mirum]|uniref:Phenazine biosynthesis protein PhzF family n=1 Tax=Actinosynnema mirum (strain ATCC 29888 / DSM 43827 / JCM 3225 / NBRC 14064 / NCIMB 13271 / NRRL B-12336 / IMRU 3971 / 101) TaxID=446462 RepID=C6WLA4_ACTMD|nr:PhzF family phenazine biosynthesis isomerase [Actinosynnema mirum]ACU36457.1 phenazine biosynthesis protein PhzF family [Actinosynnema mirum DSM 43827]
MELLRYTAFSTTEDGGNPAGVVLDATGTSDSDMLATAAELGYSETAFATPEGPGRLAVRYFSPLVEVPFCGHATIALAVAHAERHSVGELLLRTQAGPVRVKTERDGGLLRATLVSVPPRTAPITPADLDRLLAALRWERSDLDPALPPAAAYAGAWHPVIAAASRERLARLDYDLPVLGELMAERDWATVDLVWRESASVFHCRNPFPPGGVVEDPATGAAAAALGGYLRELDLAPLPHRMAVRQGEDMGRPSLIEVEVPADREAGIAVSGCAVRLTGPAHG